MKTAPSIKTLFDSISTNLKHQFGINDENDLKRVLSAMAASDAGLLKIIYLALLDVQKNILPDLADPQSMGGTLERYGRLKLGRDPNPATQGKYTVTVKGVAGTNLNLGTQLVNKVTNKYYTTTAALHLTTTTGIASISADKSGSDTLQVGDVLFTVNTITNIQSQVTVLSVVTAPNDSEDLEVYRNLILESYRLEPNGGSASDYAFWALDVPGVRTVYPYTTGPGMATIYAEGLTGDGSVSSTILDKLWKNDKTGVFELNPDTTLNNYERGRRQLGFTDITMRSVTVLPVIITITNLKDGSEGVSRSIIAELKNMLRLKRPYIAGIGDINDRNDTLYFRDIVTALDNALESGNTYDDVTVTVNTLALPFQFTEGNIPSSPTVIYE